MALQGQTKLISVGIILLGIVASYLAYSQASEDLGVVIDLNLPQRGDISEFSSFNIDFSILDDERFTSLVLFGESPVKPGITGRKDIFAPF